MDAWIWLLIIAGIAMWIRETAYKDGKREGSRKGYGVGYSRGRKAGSSGCLVIVVLLGATATVLAASAGAGVDLPW